jgi:hypothetical protein
LVKELASAVGMLVYTPGSVVEMPCEQNQMNPEMQEGDRQIQKQALNR